MKINVFTFTRDRCKYTKISFAYLRKNKEKYSFNHYVLDNGSTDGTKEFLNSTCDNYTGMVLLPVNHGLHKAAKLIKSIMMPCDIVIKIDNDAILRNDQTIKTLALIYERLRRDGRKYILSPDVRGIVRTPARSEIEKIAVGTKTYKLGTVGQLGGLCMAIPYEFFSDCQFNPILPLARYLDSSICAQARALGYKLAYVEDLVVEHYKGTDNQRKDFNHYFKRKRKEEKENFDSFYKKNS